MNEEKKYRIGWGMVFILLGLSVLGDTASLIPFIGDIVAPIYFGFMTWYLWKTGHGLMNVKIIIPEAISVVAELIPVVQELPTMIAATLVIIVISRFEDKSGVSLFKPLSSGQKVRLPRRAPPLNKGGSRMPRKQEADVEEEDDMEAA